MFSQNILRVSHAIRRDIIEMGFACGSNGAHFGGSLSLVEIMAVLYGGAMKYNHQQPMDETRDRLILSKGHGIMALYAALHQFGRLTDSELADFKQNGSKLSAHPSKNPELGIEFASGSLGQGLSLGVGTAMALKMRGNETSRAFVILGDGECAEGSIWEAAMTAAHYKLNNLVAIIDRNHLQYDGDTETILSLESLAEKWTAFGWNVASCDGHNEESLFAALTARQSSPFILIANTVKGKGVSFMENDARWHNGVLTKCMYEKAISELAV